MRRRTTSGTAAPLPGSIIDYLLTGECLDVHTARARGIEETYDPWAPWLDFGMPGDMACAWEQHRGWLLGEWRRRGGTGAPWFVRMREAR